MPARTLGRGVLIVSLVAVVAGCVDDDRLRSDLYPANGGGSSSASTDARSQENPSDEETDDWLSQGLSTAECLIGSWAVDGPSYLKLFGAGSSGLSGALSISGVATMDFAEGTVTSKYNQWTVTAASAEGDMTLVTNGVEEAQWSLDSSDTFTAVATESSLATTLTVSIGGQEMAVPVGNEAQGVDLTSFAVVCEEQVATFRGSEGFLVLNRR